MKNNPETTYYFATPNKEYPFATPFVPPRPSLKRQVRCVEGYMELRDDADLPFRDVDKEALMARLEECKDMYNGAIYLVEEKITITALEEK
jgi:hypothetical protein